MIMFLWMKKKLVTHTLIAIFYASLAKVNMNFTKRSVEIVKLSKSQLINQTMRPCNHGVCRANQINLHRITLIFYHLCTCIILLLI